MSFFRSPARILLGLVAAFVLVTYFYSPSEITSNLRNMASGDSSSPIPGLSVTLEQVKGASPPTLKATVKNNNNRPVSVLTYNSPLESLAIPLGFVQVTPEGAKEPLKLGDLQIRRMWPPRRDDITEIAAGRSASAELPFKPMAVPPEKMGKKNTVQIVGEWMAVYDVPKKDITDEMLDKTPRGGKTYTGDYKSDKINFFVEEGSGEL
jgi:hypothetical protein